MNDDKNNERNMKETKLEIYLVKRKRMNKKGKNEETNGKERERKKRIR